MLQFNAHEVGSGLLQMARERKLALVGLVMEKQAEARALSELRDPEAPKPFAEILKEQWEAKKKELEAAKQK